MPTQNTTRRSTKPEESPRADWLPEQLPPQDLNAEQCVLGCCLLHGEAIDEAALILQPEHFYAESHQMVYTTVLAMRERNVAVDTVTVAEELGRRNWLADAGGVSALLKIIESVPHAAHVKFYATTVLDRARRRAAVNAAAIINRKARNLGDDTTELLAEAEMEIHTALECGTKQDAHSIEEILLDLMSPAGREKIEPIPTGYPSLDEIIGGVTPGQLVVVGARSSEGKSAFVTNLARRMAEQREPGLIVNYEMSRLEIAERMMVSVLNVDLWSFRRAHGNQRLLEDIARESSMMGRLPLHIVDDSVCPTVAELVAMLRVMVRRYKLRVVVIDYLQLIPYVGKATVREQQVAQITRQLKQIAGQLRVVIIVLSQLNRDVEKRDSRKPRVSDLRESGAIEQDANQVWLLWRPNLDGGQSGNEEDNVGELIVAKNRGGKTGKKGTVTLAWNGPTMTFSDRGTAPLDNYDDKQFDLYDTHN